MTRLVFKEIKMENKPKACKNCIYSGVPRVFKNISFGLSFPCFREFTKNNRTYFNPMDGETKYHSYYDGSVLDIQRERAASGKCGLEARFFKQKEGLWADIKRYIFGEKDDNRNN